MKYMLVDKVKDVIADLMFHLAMKKCKKFGIGSI
jgi:hypothetical protein